MAGRVADGRARQRGEQRGGGVGGRRHGRGGGSNDLISQLFEAARREASSGAALSPVPADLIGTCTRR